MYDWDLTTFFSQIPSYVAFGDNIKLLSSDDDKIESLT